MNLSLTSAGGNKFRVLLRQPLERLSLFVLHHPSLLEICDLYVGRRARR